MFNYNNLSDYEFEILCKDIMQRKLGIKLFTFQKGRDGGVDITDNPSKKNIIIQVKHYINSKYSDLIASLKKEVEKLNELLPQKYYVCCAVKLTAKNKQEIYKLFSDYMESANDILSLLDIDDFLEKAENIDIVRKHYKLWLESTNILSEILNQSIFVDCESLLYNIKESSKEFVATKCYYECVDILNRDRILLLLGMPGTGKTVTTKMLALYYATKGYRVRYTTNGDIGDLKNSLSTDRDLAEIVLLDDCLGQHYFKMKETQENELLSLLKYIAMNKKKMLIMNSRVTIFQQAKERSIEFRQFAEDEKFKIKILDMCRISISDKGRIFYNHIYFKGLPIKYYQNLINNYRYRKIVMHENYTPRIMEFVTREVNYRNIQSDNYFEYVMGCLNNPKEIWHDEFLEKLQQEDRVFMTTLYSLTDTSVDVETLKRAFNQRLRNTLTMDTSRNIWEDVLKRLEGAFIVIIEKNGREEIGVLNPSVNDFLKEYLQDNDIERENIKQNATEYMQVKRGFSDEMTDIMRSGRADMFYYASSAEKTNVILSYICKYEIFNNKYGYLIKDFFESMTFGYHGEILNRCEIFVILLTDKFDEFYHTRNLIDETTFDEWFWSMDLSDYHSFITTAKKYKIDFFYTEYKKIFLEYINIAISEYMGDIDTNSYCENYDIDDLLTQNESSSGGNAKLAISLAADSLCEYIKDDVEQEVFEMIEDLPKDILSNIPILRRYINIDSITVEDFIEAYFEPLIIDKEISIIDHFSEDDDEMDVLDDIFIMRKNGN